MSDRQRSKNNEGNVDRVAFEKVAKTSNSVKARIQPDCLLDLGILKVDRQHKKLEDAATQQGQWPHEKITDRAKSSSKQSQSTPGGESESN